MSNVIEFKLGLKDGAKECPTCEGCGIPDDCDDDCQTCGGAGYLYPEKELATQ